MYPNGQPGSGWDSSDAQTLGMVQEQLACLVQLTVLLLVPFQLL